MSRKRKNDIKSLPERVEQSFPQKSCSILVSWLVGLGFGGLRTSLGSLLDASSPAFGSSGAALGLSWTLLGCLLGRSWALLAISWLVWGASWVHFASRSLPEPPKALHAESQGYVHASHGKFCLGVEGEVPRQGAGTLLCDSMLQMTVLHCTILHKGICIILR